MSSAGSWVSRFENDLCTITGSSHTVVVSNGTNALRLALHLVGVGAGDEVILPPLSFVATANAISHLGAVPHFVDVEHHSLGLCPVALAHRLELITEQRAGFLFNKGNRSTYCCCSSGPCLWPSSAGRRLRDVAGAWGLPLVEDAAEALGSWRGNNHCGLFGSVGTLSFNGNKIITTGGGGALLTHDSSLAKRAQHLSTTAKKSTHGPLTTMLSVGTIDYLTLNAALGVAQLDVLPKRLEAKRRLAISTQKSSLILRVLRLFRNLWIVAVIIGW